MTRTIARPAMNMGADAYVYLKKIFNFNEKVKIKTKNTWDEFDNKWMKCYNDECGPTAMPLDIQNKPPKTKCEPPEEDDRIIALD
jgi:hypothetical protein